MITVDSVEKGLQYLAGAGLVPYYKRDKGTPFGWGFASQGHIPTEIYGTLHEAVRGALLDMAANARDEAETNRNRADAQDQIAQEIDQLVKELQS